MIDALAEHGSTCEHVPIRAGTVIPVSARCLDKTHMNGNHVLDRGETLPVPEVGYSATGTNARSTRPSLNGMGRSLGKLSFLLCGGPPLNSATHSPPDAL